MNGNDTFLDVNNSHLRVTSGNVYATAFNLDQIEIVASANTVSTVNFNNDTKAFNAVSNIEVGTANLFVDTTTTRVGIGTTEPAYTLDVHGSANVGAITSTAINMSGHIIPTTNATYDIGSAAFKIRDMYVDDNSLWIGDEAKISFTDNQLKFRRRKKTIVPSGLTTIGAAHSKDEATVQSEALELSVGVNAVADMKLHHWVAYAKHLDPTKTAGDIYTDSAADYEASAASEAFKEVGDDIYSAYNISIGKTTAPTSALDVNGSIRGGYDQDVTSYLGRAAIGYAGQSDNATFAHVDHNSSTNYALRQTSTGQTMINTKGDQSISFRVGDTEKASLTSGGDFIVDTNTLVVKASSNRVGINNPYPTKKLHLLTYSSEIMAGLDHGTGGNDEHVGLGFGLAGTTQPNRIFKAGIFFQRKGGDTGRGDLLFCVENTQDNTTEVSPANVALKISRFGEVSATNSLTAASFSGSGAGLTAIPAAQITGTLAVANGGTGVNGSTGTGNVVLSNAPAFSGDVAFDTNTLFVDSTNNRVGIGTSSPSQQLDVRGGLNMRTVTQSTTFNNPWYNLNSTRYTYSTSPTSPGGSLASPIDVTYSKNVKYTTTGGLKVSPPDTGTQYFNTIAVVDQTFAYTYGPFNTIVWNWIVGPIGASVITPYLNGDVFSSTRFINGDEEEFTGFAIGQAYRYGSVLDPYTQTAPQRTRHHSADMYFKTASQDGTLTEKMRIDRDGNVGIGTTDPSKSLDIGFGDYGYPGIRFSHTDTGGIDRKLSGYENFYTGLEAVIERYADKDVRYTGSNVPEVTHRINLGYSDSYSDSSGFYPDHHEMHFEVMNKVNEGDSTAVLSRIMTL